VQGVDKQIIQNGQLLGVSGTSCSTPIFASVIALINDRLIAAGKSTLGFLNPLYVRFFRRVWTGLGI
jgi:tripeptidyl-peptidase-1